MDQQENKYFQKNLSAFRKQHPALFALMPPALQKAKAAAPSSPTNDAAALQGLQSINTALQSGMDFLYLLGFNAKIAAACIPDIIQDNRGVVIIEPSWRAFASALTAEDIVPLFRSRRVFWALGDGLQEQIESLWKQTYADAAAKPFLQSGDPSCSGERLTALKNIHTFLSQELPKRKRAHVAAIQNIPARLQERNRVTPLLWTYSDLRSAAKYSTIQHVLIRTLLFYLRRLGWRTRYAVMKPDSYYPPYFRILDMVYAKPDAIFLCNQSPSYDVALGADFSRSLPIPKLVWFADDPFYAEHFFYRNGVSPDEHFWVADEGWRQTLERHSAQNIGFMPGAVTKTRRGPKRAGRECDIVFVGQIRDHRQFINQLSPAWRKYAESFIAEKIADPRRDVLEIMKQFPMPGDVPHDRMDELRQYLLWEANTRYRLQIIQSLSQYDLHIYGNAAWKALLPPDRVERCYKGIAPFKRLFEIYRNSRITLNIHSLQSYTCLNVRDFDVPAAGGFLLSDWLPKADDVFKPGFVSDLPLNMDAKQEVFFYRNLASLNQIIAYFLENTDQRLACIERARLKIIQQHTYAQRAEMLAGYYEGINQSKC